VTNGLDTSIICDLAAPANYTCTQCEEDIETACNCIFEEDVHTIDVYCLGHNAIHQQIDVYSLISLDIEEDGEDNMYTPGIVTGLAAFFGETVGEPEPQPEITYSQKCRHYNMPVEMADGTTVYASSCHSRPASEKHVPDWGLYLDGSWQAAGPAYTVDWPDYNIPTRLDAAALMIVDVFNKARRGLWVEVGCIGGHGRTGTALACMAVLGGMNPEDAITHVRSTYCEHTIETADQEWYIDWFDKFVNGGEIDRLRWDKKKQEWKVVRTYSYSVGYDWENYDPEANPKGAPPEEMQETVINRKLYDPYPDPKKSGKWRTQTVTPSDPEWNDVVQRFIAQEEAKATAAANQ